MRTLRSIRYFLLALVILAIPATAHAQFSASINVAPPELVVYSQPICPQEGYLWTPGYWGYGEEGYFWVPGTWVEPPSEGLLWTPGYWGWGDGGYAWNGGYWGPEVGFYGGVNYGFGYGGNGYEGGYWRNNHFSYNTYVNNVRGGHFRNTYNKRVVVNRTSYVSYNGGSGGITARPTAAQERFDRGHHTSPTAAQSSQREYSSKNREMLASVNHGRPAIAATSKPGEFTGKGVVAAREAPAEHKATEREPRTRRRSERRPKTRPQKTGRPRRRRPRTELRRTRQRSARRPRTGPQKTGQPRRKRRRTGPPRTRQLSARRPKTRPRKIVRPRTKLERATPPRLAQLKTRQPSERQRRDRRRRPSMRRRRRPPTTRPVPLSQPQDMKRHAPKLSR